MLARGRDHEVFDRAIDVQVSRLRKLVEPDPANPRYIQTVWGFGYVYVPDAQPGAPCAHRRTRRSRTTRRETAAALAVRAPRPAAGRRGGARRASRVSCCSGRTARTSSTGNFRETKLVQLQAIRAALEGADGPQRRESLAQLNREYGVRIVPESERAPCRTAARRSVDAGTRRAPARAPGAGDRRSASRRARRCCSCASSPPTRRTGWAFRCRRARRPTRFRRARSCGRSSCSRACSPPPSSSRATSRGRCAT